MKMIVLCVILDDSDQEVNDVSGILKLDAAFPSVSDLLSLR